MKWNMALFRLLLQFSEDCINPFLISHLRVQLAKDDRGTKLPGASSLAF